MSDPDIVIVPIEIRPGLVCKVALPTDITKAEAEKVSAVVIAYASEDKRLDRGVLLTEVAEALQPFVKSPITFGKRFDYTDKNQHIVAGVTVGDWDRLIDVAKRLGTLKEQP